MWNYYQFEHRKVYFKTILEFCFAGFFNEHDNTNKKSSLRKFQDVISSPQFNPVYYLVTNIISCETNYPILILISNILQHFFIWNGLHNAHYALASTNLLDGLLQNTNSLISFHVVMTIPFNRIPFVTMTKKDMALSTTISTLTYFSMEILSFLSIHMCHVLIKKKIESIYVQMY